MAVARTLKTKQRAVRAALREAERLLTGEHEICLHIYASLGVISVIETDGRKKNVVARFAWPTEAA